MIQRYFSELKRIVNSYAVAPFVLDAQLSFELRPGDQGFVSGAMLFKDQSNLHFREYLDSAAGRVSKLMYSYHYQDADIRTPISARFFATTTRVTDRRCLLSSTNTAVTKLLPVMRQPWKTC